MRYGCSCCCTSTSWAIRPSSSRFCFCSTSSSAVVTNLVGGWLAARTGLRFTLVLGLGIQAFALVLLAMLNPSWSTAVSVSYVMGCQALSGMAKDLTKMSAKSAVKVLVPAGDESGLFRWVAILTGSKNALKGVGFFLGGFLLSVLGFNGGACDDGRRHRHRVALRGDVAALDDRPAENESEIQRRIFALGCHQYLVRCAYRALRRQRRMVRGQRAGVPQQWPGMDVHRGRHLPRPLGDWLRIHSGGFACVAANGDGRPVATAVCGRRVGHCVVRRHRGHRAGIARGSPGGLVIPAGLALFGVVFALNSAVHSYLVLAYAESERVSVTVGFYYMANAIGRLLGTLLSGLLYQYAGVIGSLWGSALLAAIAGINAFFLPSVTAQGAWRSIKADE